VDHFDDSVLRDCYSQSKVLATQAVLDAVRERGLNACVVHPSGIMGPEDFAVGETTSTMIKIINGEMPAGIDGSFNLCDVRDLADGTIRAAEKGRSGECYILGNREVRFRDFARMIAEEAGTKPMRIFLSLGMANLMGKVDGEAGQAQGHQAADDLLLRVQPGPEQLLRFHQGHAGSGLPNPQLPGDHAR